MAFSGFFICDDICAIEDNNDDDDDDVDML